MSALARMTKAQAQYTPTHHGTESCGRCVSFQPPHGCDKVTGWVQAEGWCRLFEAKER